MKHNKKRNTAFIYEALIKEVTKSIIEKDATRKNCIIAILKENFGKGTTLGKELELYKALSETKNTQLIIAEKILHGFSEKVKEKVLNDFAKFKNVVSTGRNGLFLDINMHDAMVLGAEGFRYLIENKVEEFYKDHKVICIRKRNQ